MKYVYLSWIDRWVTNRNSHKSPALFLEVSVLRRCFPDSRHRIIFCEEIPDKFDANLSSRTLFWEKIFPKSHFGKSGTNSSKIVLHTRTHSIGVACVAIFYLNLNIYPYMEVLTSYIVGSYQTTTDEEMMKW